MKEKITINRALASKVLSVVDKGLSEGMGRPEPGHMCVEAAVNYAMGLKHDDEPPCVGSAVRGFKIELNDQHWPSKTARAKGMREVAIAQLGSVELNQKLFLKLLDKELAKQLWPLMLHKSDATTAIKQTIQFMRQNRDAALTPAKQKEWTAELGCYLDNNNLYSLSLLIGEPDYSTILDELCDGSSPEVLQTCANACRDVLIEMKSPGAKFLFLCKK